MSAAEILPIPFTEAEAARKLGVSKATLTRERLAGRISPIRMGQRIIRYTDAILNEYRNRLPEDIGAVVDRARECRTPLFVGTGVYLLWAGDEVVYVGRTATFHTRLASHVLCKEFDSYSFLAVPQGQVGAVEAGLIRHLRPKLNVQFMPEAAP